MPRLSLSFVYRRKKLMLATAVFGIFILPNLSGPGHHLAPDMDKIADSGFLRRLVGLEDPALTAFQRLERALFAERTYGAECSLDQLGVPSLVHKQGCMGPLCEQMTCKNLLFGSGSEPYYDFAIKWMGIHPVNIKSEAEAGKLAATNCSTFIELGGYHMEPPTAIEGDMVIAYNLLVHKDIEQVELLLQAIYRPQNIYCVHVDAKASPTIHRSMAALVNCLPNVYLVSEPVRIVYAGYSRLQADINCMKDQISHPVHWHYLINQPGQAFPLKTNEEIVQILNIYNGANDIEGIYGPRVIRNRFEKVWEERDVNTNLPKLEHNGVGKEPPPYNLDILKGNVYGIFSRDFVAWVLQDKMAKALLHWSINTWSPDEHYWATLHHTFTNPQLKPPGGFSGRINSYMLHKTICL